MAVATCVECDEEITIGGRPRLGQKVICSNCSARLEVVNISPLEVDWAYEEDDDDDWDDDYDDSDLLNEDDEFDDLEENDDDLDDDDDDAGRWR